MGLPGAGAFRSVNGGDGSTARPHGPLFKAEAVTVTVTVEPPMAVGNGVGPTVDVGIRTVNNADWGKTPVAFARLTVYVPGASDAGTTLVSEAPPAATTGAPVSDVTPAPGNGPT
jgi:hypothetical protein